MEASPPSSPGRAPADWRTTRWSVVLRAGGDDAAARLALSELCAGYWRPLHAFALRSGEGRDGALDAVQGFLADLLERKGLARVDPARGRFRSFLRAAFAHFLANERERARARKRGGGAAALSLDHAAEGGHAARLPEPIDGRATPEEAFDRAWAVAVLERALSALRNEYAGAGKLELFEALRARITPGEEGAALREVGARLGLSESAIKVAAHRLRRRYRDALRSEVARTVGSEDDVDEELRELFAALGGRPRHPGATAPR